MTILGPGSTISHYRIVDTLGHGGQATAFKAEDLRLSRPVVIKALKPELAASETARRRFEREATLCSALDNPHIQAVDDVGESDGLYYIVLQYVEGPTLKQHMAGRPLETLFALSIAIQLADALAVAHAAGIVHRDLKPSNLLLVGGAVEGVTLIDFGVVRLGAMDRHLTMPGTMLGTPGYMAPEQARSEPVIDARADVFSLGCVMFRCLTGRSPFRGADALAVQLKIILDETPRLRAARHGVPDALTELITLGRTLKQRATDVLAYFDRPGTSNGPTEAINGRIEHLRGSALGFRNLTNYVARCLLEAGGFRPHLHRQL